MELDEKVRRHREFWRRGPVERPLIAIWTDVDYSLAGQRLNRVFREGYLRPQDVAPEALLSNYERMYAESQTVMDDAFWVAMPLGAMPWMEAILGCPICYDPSSDSIWSEPVLDRWGDIGILDFSHKNPWFRKLMDFTEVLVSASQGRFPVGVPLLRGPLDMAAALRGTERLCLDTYDRPEKLRELLAICTDIWIEVVDAVLDRIRPFQGGYVNRMRIWSPGRGVLSQEDASVFLSPTAYRRFVMPCDVRICRHYPYVMIHLHSAGLHVLDAMLEIEELAGVQAVVDQTDPQLEEFLPRLAAVQAHDMPLVLYDEFKPRSFAAILAALDRAGLCLTAKVHSPAEGTQVIHRLEAASQLSSYTGSSQSMTE